VIANVHPIRSAVGEWHTTREGAKQFILDHYIDESERHCRMLDCDFTNFHRTLTTCVKGFRKSAFLIDDILEPSVDAEGSALFPELADELKGPNFLFLC
jgi:hypothetical protein